MFERPAHSGDLAVAEKLLVPEAGSLFRYGEVLEAQPRPGCAQHGKQAPGRKRTKSGGCPARTKMAKRIRHERSEGMALIMESRKVFGSFVKLHVGKVLWFKSIRGDVGMSQLNIHDK